jgi:hypothetical protein
LAAVDAMRADFGATDILSPLKDIFKNETEGHRTRRVFLLTDGQVRNKPEVF